MKAHLKIGTLQWGIGGLCILIGALMLVVPHQFAFVGAGRLSAYLPIFGTVATLAGLLLVGQVVLSLQLISTPYALAGGTLVLGAVALLFARTGAWFNALIYLAPALALGLSLALPPAERRQPARAVVDLFPGFMGGLAVLTGLLLLISSQFSPGFSDLPRHSQYLPLSGLFLLAGLLLLLALRQEAAQDSPGPTASALRPVPWQVAGIEIFLSLVFLAFSVFLMTQQGLWISANFYGWFGTLLLLFPWIYGRVRLPRPASVHARLALLLASAAVLPLIFTTAIASAREELVMRESILAGQRDLAVLVSDDIREYIGTRRSALLTLAGQYSWENQPFERQQARIQAFSHLFPDLSFFALYDAEGSLVVDSTAGDVNARPAAASVSGLQFFETARQEGIATFQYIRLPHNPYPVLWFGAPVLEQGEFTGLLTFELTFSNLFEFINRRDLQTPGVILLVDSAGRTISHPTAGGSPQRVDLSGTPSVQAFLEGGQAGSLDYWSEAGLVLSGYARDPEFGWGVIAQRMAAEDALAGVYAEREISFLALGLFFVIATALGLVLSGRITRRLRALSYAAESLSDGDFSTPLPRSSVLEVDNLSLAFGEMRSSLANLLEEQKKAGQDLRQARDDLESRVEERTQELSEANQALSNSNQLLRTVLETAPAAIWIADSAGTLIQKNHMVDVVWGREAPLSRNIEEYGEYRGWWADTGEELKPADWAAAIAIQEGRTVLGQLVDIQRFDGEIGTILNSAAPILSETGEILGAVIISQDITQQRKVEKQVRQQAAEVEAVISALADAVVVFDPNGRIVKTNPALARLLGWEPGLPTDEEALAQTTLIEESGSRLSLRDLAKRYSLAGKIVLNQPATLVSAAGEPRRILASTSPIYLHGDLQGVVVVLHDVSERENLLEENRRNRELLEAIFATDPGGMAVLAGDDLVYQMANPAYRELTPNPEIDPLGRTYEEIWPSQSGFQVAALIRQVLASGEGADSARHKRIYPDGSVRYFSLHLRSMEWGDQPAVLSVLWETSSLEYAQRSAETSAAEAHERAVQLALEQARLRTLLEHAPAGVVMTDPDGALSLVNPAANAMLGGKVTGDIFGPKGGYTLHHLDGTLAEPGDLPLPRTLLQRQPVEGVELLVRHESGAETVLLVNATPVLTPEGEVGGAVAILQDITERKRAEEQVHFLVKISDFLSSPANPPEIVQGVSRMLATFLGLDSCTLLEIDSSQERLIEHGGYSHRPGLDGHIQPLAALPVEALQALQAGDTVSLSGSEMLGMHSLVENCDDCTFTLVPLLRQGELAACLVAGLRRPAGFSPASRSLLRSVAERLWLAYENACLLVDLTTSEERFRASVENLLDGFAILSAVRARREDGQPGEIVDFCYEYVNPAGCRLNRRSLEEQVGRSLLELLPGHRNQALFDQYVRVVETGEPFVKDALAYEDIYGGEARLNRIFDMRAVRLEDGFALTWRDVTERTIMAQTLQDYAAQLERSNHELEQFAFVASHDLQEPLRKVKVFGDMLLEQAADRLESSEKDFLVRMQHAVMRMQTMIRDLLAFSRVTTKGQPFDQVSLRQIAEEVTSDLDGRIVRTQASVEIGDLPTIEADPMQMRQLLLNLLGNALKFHRKDVAPVVRIYSRPSPEGGMVQFVVEDNGIGFDMQNLERIFQPFERLHGLSQYEGTGMGLAICAKIVQRHHGRIEAFSRPGHGTQFSISLPIHQPLDRIEPEPVHPG